MEGEEVLDEYFSQWYDIKHATLTQQKDDKIDRLFRPKGSDEPWKKVEYKTDSRTDQTGNLFIETWSAVEWRRYGWAFASKADIIIYYALPDTVYILERLQLQGALLNWIREYKPFRIKNVDKNGKHLYFTEGLAIPTEIITELIGRKRVRRLP
jgi:hypothetical protein